MRIVMFYHSLLSDWNHGNAHFLRGVAAELIAREHEVRIYEPRDAWSLQSLLAEHGEAPIREFQNVYPQLTSIRYDLKTLDLDEALEAADLVLVHEWNEHALVKRIGEHHHQHHQHHASCPYRLFFHDTHHRAVTNRHQMMGYDLRHYDGVLAFGKVVRDIYLAEGWAARAWTWHEAADTRIFKPVSIADSYLVSDATQNRALTSSGFGDLVWIGNWGDEERTTELHEFLLEPVRALGLRARVYGVQYPNEASTLR